MEKNGYNKPLNLSNIMLMACWKVSAHQLFSNCQSWWDNTNAFFCGQSTPGMCCPVFFFTSVSRKLLFNTIYVVAINYFLLTMHAWFPSSFSLFSQRGRASFQLFAKRYVYWGWYLLGKEGHIARARKKPTACTPSMFDLMDLMLSIIYFRQQYVVNLTNHKQASNVIDSEKHDIYKFLQIIQALWRRTIYIKGNTSNFLSNLLRLLVFPIIQWNQS